MEWNEDASELANAYVGEVRRVCEARGIDAETVSKKVTQRILAQVMASGVEVVSADLVRGILAAAGPAESWAAASVPPPLPPGGAFTSPPPGDALASRKVWRGSSNAPMGCVIVACVCFGGLVFVSMLAAILLPALARAREAARRAACQNNLKQVNLMLQMYANEHGGNYPGFINEPGYLIFGGEVMNGMDLSLFQCPADSTDESERFDDGSVFADSDYIYLGYGVRDQAEMDAVVKAAAARGHDLEGLMASGAIAGPHGAINPLQANRPDAADIPVMVEWYSIHIPDGANVVYLDGHTEYIRFGSEFPVTEEFYKAAQAMMP